MTEEKVREYEEKHPEIRRASWKVPTYGLAGTAANYVVHISKLMGLKNEFRKGKKK